MSSDVVISAEAIGKAYMMYAKPQDRLKQMILRHRKYFQEYWAVQNVDLTIRRGETVGIIGRNGSGKSTLLQIIAGTLQATTGNLSVTGRVAPLLELGAGFNPEFTGRENVHLASSILGLTSEQIAERYQSIVDFSGLGDFVNQPVMTYSSGMYARLAFAVAAHVDADILIVDEILAVGDAAFTQKCMRYIRQFKETGTLLFVSHDTSSVNSLCDRVVWMDKGQVRAEGATKDVTLQYQASLQQPGEDDGFSISGRKRELPSGRRKDFRHELLQASDKRNVIEVFEFDSQAPSFGKRGGTIRNVRILDGHGAPLAVLEGGEEVSIEVTCQADSPIERPIVGFLLKDKTGQNLLGDNTYLTYSGQTVPVEAGHTFRAVFTFQLPYLPPGDYSVSAALAEGTQTDHVQHHWMDEALMFRCENSHSSYGTTGLLGIPMHDIRIETIPAG